MKELIGGIILAAIMVISAEKVIDVVHPSSSPTDAETASVQHAGGGGRP